MAKSFSNLRSKMNPKAKAKTHTKTKSLLAEMLLQELRQARNLSQEKLAELLETKQANISRIERRTDMYISTLRNYIEAMGGKLEIVAKFRDGSIHIKQFHDIDT